MLETQQVYAYLSLEEIHKKYPTDFLGQQVVTFEKWIGVAEDDGNRVKLYRVQVGVAEYSTAVRYQ